MALLAGGQGLAGRRNATYSAGTLVDPEAIELLERQSRGMLDSTEQRILLERLLTSGQPKLAQYVLEDELSKGPLPINHRLLLMDLLRINGDAAGARQQLTQLFRLHPNHPDLLVADVLLKHHSGQKAASLNQLQERFSTTALKDRVDLGLLLADLQRQSGRPGSAATLYLQLAAEDPGDARPLIALAMLRQEQGKPDEVRLLLNKARLRRESRSG